MRFHLDNCMFVCGLFTKSFSPPLAVSIIMLSLLFAGNRQKCEVEGEGITVMDGQVHSPKDVCAVWYVHTVNTILMHTH